ncbi:MAG: DUF2313 domain-containing protein [Thalassobaculaceae bacterium]
MRATDDTYRDQLLALAPVGQAWPRDPDARFPRLLHGLAGELARTHNRALDLIEEADPRTADEMLEDWERVAGFPDPCIPLASEAEARRLAVVGRLAARGGQSAAYYTLLCAGLGYAVTIADYHEFIAGEGEAGDMVLDGEGESFTAGENVAGDHLELFDWKHAWRLTGEPTIDRDFIAGESEAGQALGYRDNPVVRCIVNRLKPEHTRVAYSWFGPSPDEKFPPVTVELDGDFVAGDAEAGQPLGYRLTLTFRATGAPVATYV